MELYKSEFIVITIDQQKSIIKWIWSKETSSEKMTAEIFKRELLKETELIEKYKPKFILMDTFDFGFGIAPDIQTWIDKEVYPKWAKSGIKKIALLMSQEIIAQLSIEQAIDENSSKEMISKFFETEQLALVWLKD